MIDGRAEKPQRIHVSYRFECGRNVMKLGYRQAERSLESVDGDMARALSVDLASIKVSGRRISAQGVRAAEAVIRSYARIEYVTAECSGREVTFIVRGMNLERWLAYVQDVPEGVQPERPRPSTREIHISADGAVSIS